ncbi:hypothetical protein PO878_04145 [Iamia majanohamensis]|uniref:Uncharacterized protein n=1 Tax=Iamia majanohamensis TaxID=467976 RepID=A0AAF0BWW4_9ACTN|nr:hypothetical protein [Iamia majanohamensis]WCO67914.1 hypothetical protein PO878_04145 [Iamia majanohamensis]
MSQVEALPFPARATDPHTSHKAAARRRDTLAHRTKVILSQHPEGLTDWELAGLLYPDPLEAARRKPSAAKRRQEAGAVPVPGLTRKSPTGDACIVWALPAEVTGVQP